MEKQRAVFYARVSTEEDKQLNALEKQIQENKDVIKEKGWELVDQYIDEGKSGTTTKRRNEYKRLLEDMEQNKFDVIVVKSQDRLQRNTKDWYIFEDKLVVNEKSLYLYLENRFYTPEDALITGIKAILAAEFSREQSKKANNSNKKRIEKAKNGEKFSAMGTNMLYGYSIKDGEYVVDREQAEIVKVAYDLYLKLDSIKDVTEAVNKMGYKNQKGKQFCADSIRRMLKNEHYKGMYVLNRVHRDFDKKKIVTLPEEEWVCVPNVHEAIIDEKTWQKVNERIAEKAIKYSGKDGKIKRTGKNGGKDILSGKLFCSCCGGVMWRHKSNGYTNWLCSTKTSTGGGGKDHVSVTTLKVKAAYKDVLKGLESLNIEVNKSFIKNSFKKDLIEIRDSLTQSTDTMGAEKELEKAERKKKKITEAYLDEIITKADYKEKYKEIEYQIQKLERLLVPMEENPEIKDIDYALEHFDEEFESWVNVEPDHFEEKQIAFLINHTKKITVYKNKSLGIELDLLAGWIIVAGNNMVGYIEKDEPEGIIDEKNVGRNFMQYVLKSMPFNNG